MAVFNKNSTPLYKVTILPKAQSLGHTALIPEKDELSQSKLKLEAAIEVALGGKAAEEVFLGKDLITTGCSSDLSNATRVAYQYVRAMAMKEDVSILSGKKSTFSDEQNFTLDVETNNMLLGSYGKVKRIMKEHEPQIHRIVEELIKKETLTASEFTALLEGKPLPDTSGDGDRRKKDLQQPETKAKEGDSKPNTLGVPGTGKITGV